VASYVAGQIVIADWRDALPREPNKLRPAVVVEDDALFGAAYPNVILVPLTQDESMYVPGLATIVDPAPENGCKRRSYALAYSVTATSGARVKATPSRVSPQQLHDIRRKIAAAIGLPVP